MEAEKRKRFVDDGETVEGKKVKADDDQKKKVLKRVDCDRDRDHGDDDGEVEEFFAILRRIHVAVKYFEKGNGRKNRKNTTAAMPWSPNFEREDFEVVAGGKGVETVGDNVGLDLNAEPDPVADE